MHSATSGITTGLLMVPIAMAIHHYYEVRA